MAITSVVQNGNGFAIYKSDGSQSMIYPPNGSELAGYTSDSVSIKVNSSQIYVYDENANQKNTLYI